MSIQDVLGDVVEHTSTMQGSIAMDLAFRRCLVAKVEGVMGMPESTFPPETKMALKIAMNKWRDEIKVGFTATDITQGGRRFPFPGRQILLPR